MPVRCRSRCSIWARCCLLLRLRSRSSSSSSFMPFWITPPSFNQIGGSETIVFSMRSLRSPSSSLDACNVLSRSVESRANVARTAGIFPSEAAKASTSRGFAVSSVTRLSSLSRSSTPSSALRNSSRATTSLAWASTASSRAWISAPSIEGRSIHERSRRLPIGVTVESRQRNSVTPASVPANSGSISSRFRTVTASNTRQFCRS